MRPDFGDHLGQFSRCYTDIGVDEFGASTRRGARHPRVTPPPGPTEEPRLVYTQMPQSSSQLRDAIAAELVGGLDAQLLPPGLDYLALLTEGAGDHGDHGAQRRIACDRDAVVDGLIIGMGMDEQQPGRSRHLPPSAVVVAGTYRRRKTEAGCLTQPTLRTPTP